MAVHGPRPSTPYPAARGPAKHSREALRAPARHRQASPYLGAKPHRAVAGRTASGFGRVGVPPPATHKQQPRKGQGGSMAAGPRHIKFIRALRHGPPGLPRASVYSPRPAPATGGLNGSGLGWQRDTETEGAVQCRGQR